MANLYQEFMDLYRQLEEVLTQRFEESGRKTGSVVMDFMNDDEGAPYREDLNACREVRNLLSHHSLMDGRPIVEPSEALLGVLREVIAYVKKPMPALNFATRRENLMIAYLDQNALRVMREMKKRGYSHVPVFSNGDFVGVFSVSTVFSYIIEEDDHCVDRQTTIGDFGHLLKLDHHNSEQFAFVSRRATYWDVRDLFERRHSRPSSRLVAVFITENGRFGERVLGMITPWDIIGQEQPGQAAPFTKETEKRNRK